MIQREQLTLWWLWSRVLRRLCSDCNTSYSFCYKVLKSPSGLEQLRWVQDMPHSAKEVNIINVHTIHNIFSTVLILNWPIRIINNVKFLCSLRDKGVETTRRITELINSRVSDISLFGEDEWCDRNMKKYDNNEKVFPLMRWSLTQVHTLGRCELDIENIKQYAVTFIQNQNRNNKDHPRATSFWVFHSLFCLLKLF